MRGSAPSPFVRTRPSSGTSTRCRRRVRRPPRCTSNPHASFDVLAGVVRTFYCNDHDSLLLSMDGETCSQVTTHMTAPSGSGHGLEARLVKLEGPETVTLALILRSGGQAAAFDVAEANNPGAFGLTSDAEVKRYELVDAIPGGSDKVRLDVETSDSDSNEGGCSGTDEAQSRTILCTADGGLRCAELLTAKSSGSWSNAFDGCNDEDSDDDGESGFTLAVELHGSELRLSLARDNGLAPPAGLVGTHAVATLMTQYAMAPLPKLVPDR